MIPSRMKLTAHLVLLEKIVAAGTEWLPEPHGLTFLQVRTGDGFLLQAGKPRQLAAGDLIILPPRASSALRASQLGDLRLEYFHVVLDMLSGILTSAEHKHLAGLLHEDGWLPQYWAVGSPLADQFALLSEAARRGQHLLARCQMLHVAVSVLASRLPAQVTADTTDLTSMARFEELIRKLPEAELRYRSTAELAKLCGCSPRHFRRLFKEHFGHGLTLKKNELRLLKARDLLSETNAKIIEVALDSGFQHVGRFTTLFKRRYGVAPAEWRHRQRAAQARLKK